MVLGFEHDGRVVRFKIEQATRAIAGHIGYRKLNYILLIPEYFKELQYALYVDDFEKIKTIINNVVDFDSHDLPWERKDPDSKYLLV